MTDTLPRVTTDILLKAADTMEITITTAVVIREVEVEAVTVDPAISREVVVEEVDQMISSIRPRRAVVAGGDGVETGGGRREVKGRHAGGEERMTAEAADMVTVVDTVEAATVAEAATEAGMAVAVATEAEAEAAAGTVAVEEDIDKNWHFLT